jgi:hypothetical protein
VFHVHDIHGKDSKHASALFSGSDAAALWNVILWTMAGSSGRVIGMLPGTTGARSSVDIDEISVHPDHYALLPQLWDVEAGEIDTKEWCWASMVLST